MLKVLSLVTILFIIQNGFSQTTFQKVYGGTSDEGLKKVLKTADGGYLYAGNSISFGSSSLPDCYIMKTNANGIVQWAKAYGEPGWKDFIDDIIPTSDGGYAFTGTAQEPITLATKILFAKIDSVGNLQFQNSYAYTTWEIAYQVIQTSDGGYMIAADSRVNGQYYDILMIKLDATGNVQWAKANDGTATLFEFKPVLIHQTQDGGYVVIGSYINASTFDQDPLVFKTDSAGNEVWKYHYQGANMDYIKAATYVPDQGYYLAGSSFTSNYDGLLMKIGLDGSLHWSKSYGSLVPFEEFLAIEYVGNDKLLLSGRGDNNGQQTNIFFTGHLMDTSGTAIWQKWFLSYNSDVGESGNTVLAANDGGYLFASHGYSGFSSWNIYSVKTDANGSSGCFDAPLTLAVANYPLTATSYSGYFTIAVSQNSLTWTTNTGSNVSTICEYIDSIPTGMNENIFADADVIVYPNPASEMIHIDSKDKNIAQVQIYNLLGERMISHEVNSHRMQVSTAHLSNGMYFLKIYFSDKSAESKKIQVIKTN